MSLSRRVVRVTGLVTVLTVLLACGLFGGIGPGWNPVGGDSAPPEQGAGSVPARVGAPEPWTADALESPIGSASVLYTSNTWFPDESGWLAGLVGRSDDSYRVAELYGPAGMGTVLSPDGTRLAAEEGIADLATGRVTAYQGVTDEDHEAGAQAWSPDGRSVAVLVGEWTSHGGPAPDVRLLLADAGTGETREIARLRTVAALPGWTVAFSPDGSRLAFQNGAGVRVITLADGTGVDVPLPDGARLAGKGAWSRDGRNLLVVSGARCDCGEHPVRWTVTEIAVDGGAPTGRSWSRDGVYALRVLGWWPSGGPVAVEYTPTEYATPTLFQDPAGQYDLTSQNMIRTASLVDLGTSTVLLSGDDSGIAGDVESLDVPDQVLASGVTRPGDPPLFDLDLITVVVSVVIAAEVMVLLAFAVSWLLGRVRRR
ncbi:TolB family protein [Actinoplanes sp. G11-F43]|uniref:TolB family protein n=1 Tax=Actinoplanes sp. G11-F43 TaxID=3424130 RepID=UPI003D3257F8